ncbi:MAG: hypothetical protein ACRC8C_00255 [Mycoplasmoidaceae bacterium]
MKKVVIGKVTSIKKDELVVLVNNDSCICAKKDVSDYNCNLELMFTIDRRYKFLLLKNENNTVFLSYKAGRPKLLKNRTCPIPTISGFKNLANDLHKNLKNYKLD